MKWPGQLKRLEVMVSDYFFSCFVYPFVLFLVAWTGIYLGSSVQT